MRVAQITHVPAVPRMNRERKRFPGVIKKVLQKKTPHAHAHTFRSHFYTGITQVSANGSSYRRKSYTGHLIHTAQCHCVTCFLSTQHMQCDTGAIKRTIQKHVHVPQPFLHSCRQWKRDKSRSLELPQEELQRCGTTTPHPPCTVPLVYTHTRMSVST